MNPDKNTETSDALTLRAPHKLMKLARLGAFHQTRLSFMRVLLRRVQQEHWQFKRTLWSVDQQGVGVGVYTAQGPVRCYSLVAFANDLDPGRRSDRVIAEEWDATFVLFDGIPGPADIERLRANVPLQEAGRVTGSELTLSRANRSVRLFEYVKQTLASGQQPDAQELDKIGYLMRTTAVYGSGKFGACDRRFIADREEFAAPFQTEMLTVLMIRAFSVDIVEHLARVQNPDSFVPLANHLKKRLGIGNSTGLGMAPFIINHPVLLNHWITARETALARVRSMHKASAEKAGLFKHYLQRQIISLDTWHTDSDLQARKIVALKSDLASLQQQVSSMDLTSVDYPWEALFVWAEQQLSLEGQECLVTLLLEPHAELVDDLSADMSVDESRYFNINGRMLLAEVRELLDTNYRFAASFDPDCREQNARFWYASEEKLEPRLGERFEEQGAEREHPLATARDVAALATAIDQTADQNMTVAEFLLQNQQHRHSVRRVQLTSAHPYSEIADNLIASSVLPIDLLRCKLSFFGAVNFDPRSDRWVRITMYQHAPTLEELNTPGVAGSSDCWIYPPLASAV